MSFERVVSPYPSRPYSIVSCYMERFSDAHLGCVVACLNERYEEEVLVGSVLLDVCSHSWWRLVLLRLVLSFMVSTADVSPLDRAVEHDAFDLVDVVASHLRCAWEGRRRRTRLVGSGSRYNLSSAVNERGGTR